MIAPILQRRHLLDEDYLTLSTIHSAEGMKWQAVYLLNAVDGCMPADLQLGTGDRHVYGSLTRLIPSAAAALFHPGEQKKLPQPEGAPPMVSKVLSRPTK